MLNNKVRIIGGRWRGRKLAFPSMPGLRPSSDRIRETLFNWLSPNIIGAHCLDLFAGSGALGLEAASRGAAQVVLVDKAPAVIRQLHTHQTVLQADNLIILPGAVPHITLPAELKFQIVFLDPPFGQDLVAKTCLWLEASHCLAENCLLYLETEIELNPLPIPTHWQIIKAKQAGRVQYYLLQRQMPAS
jgi:16S rRNA (guanine966-N2)-methyltransferase